MKEFECKCCGNLERVFDEEINELDGFYCSICGSFHVVEELSNGEFIVEIF